MKLHMESQDGQKVVLEYDQITNKLEGMNSHPVAFHDFDKYDRSKSRAPRVLKIQMGLACNYSCSYCLQALEVINEEVSLLEDAQQFLAQLDTWIEGEPEKVEFWGGEPMVYWAKLKVLVPSIKQRFPKAAITIITNGSVLDQEKVDFLVDHKIQVGISHDGPGQKNNRGPDPFEDPEKLHWIRELARRGDVGFNAVLTKNNSDFAAIEEYIQSFFNFPVHVGLEGVVNVYDAATLLGSGGFNSEELGQMTNELFYYLANGGNPRLQQRVNMFLRSLDEERPASSLGQKCGMDRPDMIAVDLKGNVQTCQNTGAKGKHWLGEVTNFDNIWLDTSTHFSDRPECLECPVLQLCKGSCMYLEGDFFAQSCHNEFALNMAFFMAALYQLTGMVLTEIEQ